MAKFCSSCDRPVCDFCKHFDFNGEDAAMSNGKVAHNVYTGNGYCRLYSKPADPAYGCDDYYCRHADKEEAKP